jgi:hypothetical protein
MLTQNLTFTWESWVRVLLAEDLVETSVPGEGGVGGLCQPPSPRTCYARLVCRIDSFLFRPATHSCRGTALRVPFRWVNNPESDTAARVCGFAIRRRVGGELQRKVVSPL